MTRREESGTHECKVRVWDHPTRVFHWILLVLFGVCYLSGDQGRFDIHIPAGQALTVLIVARIAWGFIGSETARFHSFVRPPGEIASYIRTMWERTPGNHGGHNPLGGFFVVVMLVVLMIQVATGHFAADVDGLYEGPLSFVVSYAAARDASAVHGITEKILLALVALHVAAVIFHLLYKRENLIGSMVTGRARIGPERSVPRMVPAGRAVIVLIMSAIVVLGGIELVGHLL